MVGLINRPVSNVPLSQCENCSNIIGRVSVKDVICYILLKAT